MKSPEALPTELLIQQIVWAYTDKLDSSPNADELARFQAVLANLLLRSTHSELLGHPKKELAVVGQTEQARVDAMRETVQQGLGAASILEPLPAAIAFWPVDNDKKPKKKSGNQTLPEALKVQSPRALFKSKDGEYVYGYFEIATPVEGLPLVTSALAARQTGVPEPKAYPLPAMIFGFFAVIVFVMSLAAVSATGHLLGTARALVADANSQYKESAPAADWNILRKALHDKCAGQTGSPSLSFGGLCKRRALEKTVYKVCLGSIVPASGKVVGTLSQSCEFVWAEALQIADSEKKRRQLQIAEAEKKLEQQIEAAEEELQQLNEKLEKKDPPPSEMDKKGLERQIEEAEKRFKWLNEEAERKRPSDSAGAKLASAADQAMAALGWLRLTGKDIIETKAISLVGNFYLSMVALVGLFIAFGFGTKGRWCGLIISEQNRISLSLSQITAWSIVLLSAYAVFASFNVGTLAGYWDESVSLFPVLPGWTWAVMGITVAAPFASSLIKGNAPEGWSEHFKNGSENTNRTLEVRTLATNVSGTQADLGDLITSEELGKGKQLAISRVQNVIITATLLFTYTTALDGTISSLLPHEILTAFSKGHAILLSFPQLDATFTALLALSHGAYLAGKFKPAPKNEPND